MAEYWRRCSTCKVQLDFGQNYWVCNVSTCNRKRTGLVFCSVSCWDSHVPMMNHRDAWAEERTAPTKEEWQAEQAGASAASSSSSSKSSDTAATSGAESSGQRRVIKRPASMQMVASSSSAKRTTSGEVEVLVVASKVKNFIKEIADMNTGASAMQALTHIVRAACRDATDNARADGRKTVLDRDFKF